MNLRWIAVLLPATGLTLFAAGDPKGLPKGEGSDKFAKVEAVLYLDKAAASQAVGGILDPGIVVVEVKLTPGPGSEKLSINRDDFLLRSDRSGERSTPYSPSQIAGSTVIRISERPGGTTGIESRSGGPVWGGMGGGMPRTMPGMGPQAVGNGTASVTEASATVDEGNGKQGENPLLETLKKKILEEKEITEAATGQLYFLMEGKQKVKDLELLYKTPAGRISVRFKLPQQ